MTLPAGFSELHTEPQSGLAYRLAGVTTAPRARLLLLHGVGGNETNLAALLPHLPDGLEVRLLRAPLAMGPQSFGWFQVSFTSQGPVLNPAQAESSRQQVLRFIQALPALPTVIAGFSQGGILSAAVGLSAPAAVRGFGLLSGRIPPEYEPVIASPEALRQVSGFVAHGRQDDKLPLFWAERAQALLAERGVPHEVHYYEMGHEIIGAEVADFVAWLERRLG